LFRITIQPTPENGLAKPSQVMVDKAQTVPRDRVGDRIGRLGHESMLAVERALMLFLGFA
jgi:mRNA interferase MazF